MLYISDADPLEFRQTRISALPTPGKQPTTQQTRNILPMLDQCWASLVDGGTTLVQHWEDFSCLLGTHRYNVVSMTAQSRRLWANIKTTSDKCQPGAPPTPEKKTPEKTKC